MFNNQTQEITISEKSIYVFNDHHTALLAWAKERRKMQQAPYLITLDSHTDTRPAFTAHICRQEGHDTSESELEELSRELCRQIDFADEQSVEDAVRRLRHDEHIDCAVKSGILNSAFVIAYRGCGGTRSIEEDEHLGKYRTVQENNRMVVLCPEQLNLSPEQLNYKVPEKRIFEVPESVGYNPLPNTSDDEQHRQHYNSAIETSYLDAKLRIANRMAAALGVTDLLSEEFILDIDFDYFRTVRSIEPEDISTFDQLIRSSSAITIALEPQFVLLERIKGEDITSDLLFPKLIKHIECALSQL